MRNGCTPVVRAAPLAQRPVIGEHVGRALHGRALHVVQHAADAAHLLAAAGAAGAAVHQGGQRRAVPGGLAGVVAVEHEQPAVPRREAQDDRAGDVGSWVTSEPTRLPWPRAARAIASSTES